MGAAINAKDAGGQLGKALYKSMLNVGKSLEARGDLPKDAEEFAAVVSHHVLDQLGGALMKQNRAYKKLEAAQDAIRKETERQLV